MWSPPVLSTLSVSTHNVHQEKAKISSKFIECRILMYFRQTLQNKTAAKEIATNKQEYKGKKLYILKKRKRLSAMSVTHPIFLMLAYRHKFVPQRLRSI